MFVNSHIYPKDHLLNIYRYNETAELLNVNKLVKYYKYSIDRLSN